MKDGKANFHYNWFDIQRTTLTSKEKVAVGKEVVDVEVLNLWCADGVRSLKLNELQRVRFLNPVMDSEFKKALETLATSHDTAKKAAGGGVIQPDPVLGHAANFLYMLTGEVVYRHADQTYHLKPGDALMFDSSALHGPETLVVRPMTYLSIFMYRGTPT